MEERDLIRHLEEGGQELWQPADPPKLDLSAITGESAGQGSAAGAGRGRFSAWRRGFQLRPLAIAGGALASVAVGLALGAVIFGGSSTTSPTITAGNGAAPVPSTTATPVAQVALARFGDGPAPTTAEAVASLYTATDGKTLKVSVKNLPAPPNGSFYELWAIGKDSKMVSLGTVPVDANGTGTTEVPVPVSLRRYPILDISLERADGNPTHSGHSVLRSA